MPIVFKEVGNMLLLMWISSEKPETGSIIVRALKVTCWLLLRSTVQGPMRSTATSVQEVTVACLSGSSP